MANATENRRWAGDGSNAERPPTLFTRDVAASTEIFAGTLIGVVVADPTRPLAPMSSSGGSTVEVRGFAADHVDNSAGAEGDKKATARAETGLLDLHGVHPPTVDDIYMPIYASNDHTASNNSGDGQCVGLLMGLDSGTGKAIVWVDPYIAKIFNGGFLASGAVLSASLAVGALSADVHGRAVMATGYFTAAKVLDAFGVDSFDAAELLQLIKDGAFAADASTRALFADAIWPEAKLALTIRGEQALSGAGAVDVTHRTTKLTSTGGAQAITIADGAVANQRKTIVHEVDGGSMVLTPATPLHFATYTFTAVHDWLELEWTGAAWIIVAYGGGSIA